MANTAGLFLQHFRTLLDPARHETASDGVLLSRWVKHRDSRAFAALVWRHGVLVWRVGKSILHQPEDAEDVFQATFLILARKAGSLKRRASISGWLHHTAYRLAMKTRTATARRLRRESAVAKPIVADPLEQISVREARTILAEELDRLPAACREPLLLCFYEGATQDEAARQLGCSLSTLKRRLEEGRDLLGKRLSRRGLSSETALSLSLCFPFKAPALLVQKTIAAAEQFVAGQVLAGAAVGLANGVLRTMLLKKAIICIAGIIAIGSVTVAGGFAFSPAPVSSADHRPLIVQAAKTKEDPPQTPAPRLDRFGDPLPPGAINRLGSIHFRHGDGVRNVAYTPDGKSLASTSADGVLHLWDATTGKSRWQRELARNYYNPSVQVSADGRKLASLTDLEYSVFSADTGKILARHQKPFVQGGEMVRSVAVAHNFKTFAKGYYDATVRIFDSVTGEEKLRAMVDETGGSQIPTTIQFSADDKTLYVVAGRKPGIQVFDTSNGKQLPTIDVNPTLFEGITVSPRSRLLAAIIRDDELTGKGGPDRVVIWDVDAGKPKHIVEVPNPWRCAFSADGSLLAIGTFGRDALIVDTATGQVQRKLMTQRYWRCLAFAPDMKTIAGGDQEGCITLADTATGKRLSPFPEPSGELRELRFVEGSKILMMRATDGFYWLDGSTGQQVRTVPRESTREWVWVDGITTDGKKMTSSAVQNYTDLKSQTNELLLVDTSTQQITQKFKGHGKPIGNRALSPDGSKVFAAGRLDPSIFIWDTANGQLLHELKNGEARADRIVVSLDSRWLVSWARDLGSPGDFDIRLWDVKTGKLAHRLKPPAGLVFDAIFSADSTRLMSICINTRSQPSTGVVQMWDVNKGIVLRTFDGQGEFGGTVAMTADGRMFAVPGSDNTLRLWEVASGTERWRISGHKSRVHSLDFSPDGKLLAAASIEAPVYIWNPYAFDKHNPTAEKFSKTDREKLWQQLADTDGSVGFQALCELIGRPDEAVGLLVDGWKGVAKTTPTQIKKWIQDLNSDKFTIRKNANTQLEQFSTGHEEQLRKAIQQAESLETRQRLEQVLHRLDPERLRRGRMTEILERLASPQARQFLQVLANQAEDAELSRDAAASLKRLAQQSR